MIDDLCIKSILPADVDEIVQHCITAFHGHGMTDAGIATFIEQATDWTISRKLVTDRLIGFYLLNEDCVADWAATSLVRAWAHDCRDVYAHCEIKEDLEAYRGRRGVEGIALVVLPDYQKHSYGALLRTLPKQMDYSYIFGEHFKTANNLPYWLKTRRLVAECAGIWLTLQDL